MASHHHEKFDIERLYKLFNDCLKEDETIHMDDYVDAYEELSKYVKCRPVILDYAFILIC